MTYIIALPRRPRFVYNDGAAVDVTLSRPAGVWMPSSVGQGGSEISGAGVMAAFETRRDQLLGLELRFAEAEWPTVDRMVQHGQKAGQITVHPDSTAGGKLSWLHEPRMGDPVEPTRREGWGDLALRLVFRSADGSRWGALYFDHEG